MKSNYSNNASIPNNTTEVPITAHIFEGHLYIKDNEKWLWRLFRFDGSTLTCLSSKKHKLPPHTLLDQTLNHNRNRPISFLTNSAATNSFTSPLLATPKDKAVRLTSDCSNFDSLSNKKEQPIIASYYQLPKWTIDMINISAISIIKPTSTSNTRSYTYPFKNKQNSKTFSIRTYDGGCYIMKANKQDDLERWIFVLTKMWNFSQTARQLYQPVVSSRPQSLVFPYTKNQQQQQQQYHNGTPITLGLETSNNHLFEQHHHGENNIMNQNQKHQGNNEFNSSPQVLLSNEKVLWIEEWIKSLEELAAYGDSMSELNYISAHGSLDYQRQATPSAISDHTRPSNKTPQRSVSLKRQSIQPSHSSPSLLYNESFNHQRQSTNCRSPDMNNFNMNMFQDVNTVCTDETSQRKYNHQTLRYHNSKKEHRVKMVRNHTTEDFIPGLATPHSPPMIYNNESYSSPLENLKSAINNCTFSEQQQQATVNDENVCLADVQKFLKNMDINDKENERYPIRSRPNSTSIKKSSRNNNWHRNSWAPNISTFT